MASPGKGKDRIDLGALVEQIMDDPKLREIVSEEGEAYKRAIEATWPTDNQTIADSGDFTHNKPGEAIVHLEVESEDGRPVSIVEVRHPYAAAHQARTGAFTKAAGKNFNKEW